MTETALRLRLQVDLDLEAARAAFRGDPGRWLPQPVRRRGPGCWTTTVRTGPWARTVRCTVGDVWEIDARLWRHLAWSAEDEAGEIVPLRGLLPELHGAVGIEEDDGRAVLVFAAGYVPPGGRAGDLLDTVALRRAAAGTVHRFAEAVAARLAASANAGDLPVPGGRPGRRRLLPGGPPAAS